MSQNADNINNKQHGNKLKNNELNLKDLQITKLGRWKLNLLTDSLEWSDEIFEIFEIDKEKFVASYKTFLNAVHPDDREMVNKAYTRSIEDKSIYNIEHRLLMDDGRIKWVNEICRNEFDADEKPVYSIGIVQEITKQKKYEEALRESEKKYRFLFEKDSSGIFIYDLETMEILDANSALTSIYGYSYNELIGASCFNLNAKIKEAIEVNYCSDYNKLSKKMLWHKRKDGSVFPLELDGYTMTLNGKIAGVCIIKDITEKHKLEDYLQKSQKLESLGLLAGGIAHDFNNILSAIFGFTELAAIKTSEVETSKYLNISLQNIERAQALTQQLLTFARGGQPVKKVTSLFPFVKETVKFALSGSTVISKFSIQDNLWPCNFDKNQIGQVVDNLTINAKQAMSQGGTIEIFARNISIPDYKHHYLPEGKYVKLSVKDCGAGIPEEYLPKIFDPYYTTKQEVHGLGLATCYSIINRHNGYIDVESKLGKGSKFNVYLPASVENVQYLKKSSEKMHRGSGVFVVMDDEEPILMLVKEMLESFGYDVVLKSNGNDTVTYLRKKAEENFKIAGIMLDLTVPGAMGGKEAVEEVKKLFPEVPVFVASGYSRDPIVSNPENYGFSASIRKPFMLADLSDMLEKHIKKS